jgi:hypothetical protein
MFQLIGVCNAFCAGQNEKHENIKRGITQKVMHVELWFLHTVLPLVILLPHMKFQLNMWNSLGVMPLTK